MTYRESAFCGEHRQPQLAFQIFSKQVLNPFSLPKRQTTFEALPHIARRGVPHSNMRAEEQTKIVEEEIAEPVWVLQRRKKHLRHLLENAVNRTVNASQMLDPRPFGIVSERIERGSRNVIVDPIDRARIAPPRIRFEVVDAHASRRPHRNS